MKPTAVLLLPVVIFSAALAPTAVTSSQPVASSPHKAPINTDSVPEPKAAPAL